MSAKNPKHVFATFPEFSRLTLSDREKWETLIKDYPPYISLSFADLQLWWNDFGQLRVAQINGNIIISYFMPGDEKRSGLCLVGTKKIDESICEIFDWQQNRGDEPRIVSIPEFTCERIRYVDLYEIGATRNYDECIISAETFSELSKISAPKRIMIKRFLTKFDESKIEVKQVDLDYPDNKTLLLECLEDWIGRGDFSKVGKFEEDYARSAIKDSEPLSIGALGLYINGYLHAFILYSRCSDPDYVLINAVKLSYAYNHLFELCAHKFSQHFEKQSIKYANIESDLGINSLRATKILLGPINFLRKYEIRPKQNKQKH